MSERFAQEFDAALQYLPSQLRGALEQIPLGDKARIQEIRLRSGRPLSVFDGYSSRFVAGDGRLLERPDGRCLMVDKALLQEAFVTLCDYSVHSHQRELESGFLTTPKGDRVGVCASVVRDRDGGTAFRDISSLNLRVSREVPGAGAELLRRCPVERGVLLAGCPGSGKTTVLRDVGRALASGEWGGARKVVFVDERYEISAMFQGAPLREIGLCADAVCGLPKAEAIEQAVRTLSPEFILCDEVGSMEEVRRISAGLACGVRFLATVHCGSEEELWENPILRALMGTGAFGAAALLDSPRAPSRIRRILTKEEYDGKGFGTDSGVQLWSASGLGKGPRPCPGS